MRRGYATGISGGKMMFLLIWFYGCVTIEKIHPLEGGYLRRKVRRDRRPGMPIENPFLFYPKYLAEVIAKHVKIAGIVWRMGRTRRAIKRDPKARLYRDLALTPVGDSELDTLEMFQVNDATRAAAAKAKLRGAAGAAPFPTQLTRALTRAKRSGAPPPRQCAMPGIMNRRKKSGVAGPFAASARS